MQPKIPGKRKNFKNSRLLRTKEENSTVIGAKQRQILRLATIEDSMNPPARSSLSIILIL